MLFKYRLWDNQCGRFMATGYNAIQTTIEILQNLIIDNTYIWHKQQAKSKN